MDDQTLREMLKAWIEEQSRLWAEFKQSLSPEQKALWDAHHRATAEIAKIRRARTRLKQGLPVKARLRWPGEREQ